MIRIIVILVGAGIVRETIHEKDIVSAILISVSLALILLWPVISRLFSYLALLVVIDRGFIRHEQRTRRRIR